MKNRRMNLPLSRGTWTLARYLSTHSPAPMPSVALAGDDLLHVAKLAIASSVPRAVYVVDDEHRYLGVITEVRLAREVFAHLDPSLYLGEHARAATRLLHLGRDVSQLPARSLIETQRQSLRGRQTLTDALAALYQAEVDELPVVNHDGQLLGVIRALDIVREWVEDLLLTQLGDETGSFY